MWMMGCSDVSESFNGRKVRPHVPKPSTIAPPPTTSSATPSHHPYLSRIHGSDLLVLNHHLEQSKRDFNAAPTLVSSRWNPTPEQLQTLEELYRRGTRTPSADQIQHITAQLRRYGKIEGKNVFYWFQNHKARERQKRRRRSEPTEEQQQQHQEDQHSHNLEHSHKEPGSSRTSFEVEIQQAKNNNINNNNNNNNWGFSTNSSALTEVRDYHQESAFSMQRAERIQFDEAAQQVQQQQQRRLVDSLPTWHMMQLSCSPSSTTPLFTTTTTTTTTSSTAPPSLNIFVTPQRQLHVEEDNGGSRSGSGSGSPTLQLFPVRNNEENGASVEKRRASPPPLGTMNTTGITPHQFFEFL